jgi:hypothetical protein
MHMKKQHKRRLRIFAGGGFAIGFLTCYVMTTSPERSSGVAVQNVPSNEPRLETVTHLAEFSEPLVIRDHVVREYHAADPFEIVEIMRHRSLHLLDLRSDHLRELE